MERKDQIERLAKKFLDDHCTTDSNSGSFLGNPVTDLNALIAAVRSEAIEEEKLRCARICHTNHDMKYAQHAWGEASGCLEDFADIMGVVHNADMEKARDALRALKDEVGK